MKKEGREDPYIIGGVRRAVRALRVENEEDYDDDESSSSSSSSAGLI